MVEFNNKSRPKNKEDKTKNRDALYEGRELTLNAFESGIFPIKVTQDDGLTTTPKQVLQRLPIAL